MLTKNRIDGFKKYRHILAAMIDESIGYFTPAAALNAIIAYKKKAPFSCEWYLDMAGLGHGKKLFDITDDELRAINHDVISDAFKHRKYRRESIKSCLIIVDRNIAGNESIGASYF